MRIHWIATAFIAFIACTSTVMAQNRATPQAPAKSAKASHPQKAIYVCIKCKVYYTSKQAQKMGFKDAKGHALIKVMKAPGKRKQAAAAARAKKAAFVCAVCKTYYTPKQARKMNFTDPQGHTLTKRIGIPANYQKGSKQSAEAEGKPR